MIKLPVFNEVANEDLDQFWFFKKSIWEAQEVMDDNIKKAKLVSSLQDCALTWYMKHSNDNPNARIMDIQATVNKEFSRPMSEAESIIRFKEITMLPSETPWELDQRLKCTIHEVNMTLIDGQHCEWFVALLTPHL